MSAPVTITATNDREITIIRDFAAPRARVWEAWTTPEQVKRWFGPNGWSLPVCEIDLRPGGAWRYVMEKDTGARMTLKGTYLEVTPPSRLVSTESFDPPWYPGDAVNTLLLHEEAGVTTMTIIVRYPSKEIRDGALASAMGTGMEEGFARLEAVLEEAQ